MIYALPAFMEKTALGLVVDPLKLQKELQAQPTAFHLFLDQFFGSGMRFYGTDYAVFSELVVTPEKHLLRAGAIRLAVDVVAFPEHRQDLYKGVRLLEDNFKAEYIFQALVVETPYKQPIYGDKQADGSVPITGYENRIRQEDAVLDVDEFIAAMWRKGIRCGLQMAVIEPCLFAKKTSRMVIAQGQNAVPGKNAEVRDVYTPIRQVNSPIWVNNRLDMRRFHNKYPPVTQGRAILQKIPAQPGRSGFTVTAERVEPDVVHDLDLSQFAGAGVLIQTTEEGEVLCAAIDGYISWHADNKKISITKHIETQVDINIKNTGDMALAADQFILHGEVQEARLVKGKNMRFTAPVYGNVQSDGGHILVEDVLSGGSAVVNGEGSIAIPQKAINARIVAIVGQIDLNYAENSLIVGDVVTIGQAVHCVVLANRLHITNAKACMLAGRSLEVEHACEHKNDGTKLIVFKPDLTVNLSHLDALSLDVQHAQSLMLQKRDELAAIKKSPQFARYLQLHEAMQADPQHVTSALREEFVAQQRAQAVNLKAIERLVKELQKYRSTVTEKSAQIQILKDEMHQTSSRHFCVLKTTTGDIAAHAVNAAFNMSAYADKSPKEVSQWLQSIAVEGENISAGQEEELHWRFAL